MLYLKTLLLTILNWFVNYVSLISFILSCIFRPLLFHTITHPSLFILAINPYLLLFYPDIYSCYWHCDKSLLEKWFPGIWHTALLQQKHSYKDNSIISISNQVMTWNKITLINKYITNPYCNKTIQQYYRTTPLEWISW